MHEEPAADTPAAKTAAPAPAVSGAKWVLQTLALPLALVSLPLLYQWRAADLAAANHEEALRRETADQQFRLYTDLMSKREEADTAVRRGLFDKLMGSYLAPNPSDIAKRLVALELLSLNFHDSLNLSPLFWELAHDIDAAPDGARREELRDQLDRVAAQVKARQSATLEVDGHRRDFDVDLAAVQRGGDLQVEHYDFPRLSDDPAADPRARRQFTVTVVNQDLKHRRLWLRVESPGEKRVEFWLDPFDFPLVNFSRVSGSERFAVVMQEFDSDPDRMMAKLAFLYFPSWRSGAKDRPYIDDLMARLARPAAKAPLATAAPIAPPVASAASN